MSRDELARLVEDYSAHGGTVRTVPEQVITVDWHRDTKLRQTARVFSARGHAARKRWS